MEKKATLRLVRNATLRISYAGKNILVDPMLAEKGTLQSALGVYKTPRVHLVMPMNEIVEDLDMVLLTHNHIDHYDPTVKQHLPKGIRFFTQPQDKEIIMQDGFMNVEAIEDSKSVGSLSIHRTTGHHGFGQIGEMMRAVSGYVLTAEGYPTLYIMGDCKWEKGIQHTIEKYNPDYIVVNCGGAIFPEFSKTEGSIIPDEQEVMRMLDETPEHITFIAVHMDATDHGQTSRAILRNEALHYKIDMKRLLIPEDGECIQL
ncbi:MBL fold metallo-hydrolase [Bacteroides ndongoniae]|jgi:L-ascorbate metabolism protein UlaG (beta-lactamase superfamily)|uniref:MBL fold metallo-hydrolase n=1 Tax=Bacteroides ndongoniae TaxID=1903262 RepID=UPI0023F62829|nr:MBL fold metallo-hydrolase [Bacteroides ndongoniae]